MLNLVKKLIKDCLTGKDGVTYDPARVYLAMAVNVFLGATILDAMHSIKFDPQTFGIGFGALLAGGGLGVSLKSGTEP
jgi:hypothetical protein